ncbi:MAG TPA: DUF4407 domain-containing protein [Streptosporangiaceae bacterium]|nr:DUF4407 domain-containing protein [Streptosporangiaceae bacterium]
MAKRYLLERLGGADAQLLSDEETAGRRGERTRFAAMAGVLLTTAAVAAISMFFALHHAVGVDVGWSVPLALFWGAVILNIDRFLVITMGDTRGRPGQMAGMIVFRVALAALIATVVSLPLVLVIFASDINAELPILQQQKSAVFAQNLAHGADESQLSILDKRISTEEKVISTVPPSVKADQREVSSLTQQLTTARSQAATAYKKYQCEQAGAKGAGCPSGTSGLVGEGARAKGDLKSYQQIEAKIATLKGEIRQAESALKSEQAVASLNAANAQQTLASLQKQRTALLNQQASAIATDSEQNGKDIGLLAQIQALDAASAQNAGLAAAHWIVTALFFVIEMLPVGVKSILLLGPETTYEQIATIKRQAAITHAEEQIQADKDIATIEAQTRRDVAGDEARSRLEIRRRQLQADGVIADGKATTDENVEADMRRRDEGSRIEANERVAREAKTYVMAMMDEWADLIRDRIRQATQKQAANGHAGRAQEYPKDGYDTPDGGLL